MPQTLRRLNETQRAGGLCLIFAVELWSQTSLYCLEAGGIAIRRSRVLSWKRTERVFSCERGSRPALYGCFAWLPHAMVLPLLLLVTKITTCCSTREGVVSDTLAVLQLLPSLALYYSRKHSFASIRSISFQDILFPFRRLNAFQSE